MEPHKKHYICPAERLEIEHHAEFEHEYFDGEMFALAGTKGNHKLIATNVVGELGVAGGSRHGTKVWALQKHSTFEGVCPDFSAHYKIQKYTR
ncbi:MAG: Uma2 family endonuclease [Bacteroidetes bacterium]|nr:Uma2 family endonuclease [Bacteroidota bacterium]